MECDRERAQRGGGLGFASVQKGPSESPPCGDRGQAEVSRKRGGASDFNWLEFIEKISGSDVRRDKGLAPYFALMQKKLIILIPAKRILQFAFLQNAVTSTTSKVQHVVFPLFF